MTINATDVTEGGGIGWRLNPFPNVRTDPCDYNVTLHDGPGHHCTWMHCPGCGPPLYAADESCPDVCNKHYPGTPDGRTPTLPFPDPVPGIDTHEFVVVSKELLSILIIKYAIYICMTLW